MNAIAIIERVRNEGGNIQVQGSDIVLSAPQPLPEELVAEVREHKIAILSALQVDQIRSEDAHTLAIEFERDGRIRIESDWAGTVWLVASAEIRRGNEDGSVYFPGEVSFMVQLSPHERQVLDGFRRHFNATFEIRQWDEDSIQ